MLSRIIEWLRRLLAGLGRRDGVAEPERRSADGEFSPPEEDDRRAYPPEKGFGMAIRNALDNMDPEVWPPDSYRVSITLRADISVTNPGQIDTYRANLTET